MPHSVSGELPPSTAAASPGIPIRRLQVILIRPSKYDDEGYVIRYLRGVLPSNTMAALLALTEEARDRGELGDVEVSVEAFDEHVRKVDPPRIVRRHRRPGVRIAVALCGVQTNQFPRASDLARQFRAEGVAVLIGGFHVSGSMAMSPDGMPPECQALIEAGVTVVKGEVEDGRWTEILRDVIGGRLRPVYDFPEPPDIEDAAVPVIDRRLAQRYFYPFISTIDTGRGCPFRCTFCTIINVQGRRMRARSAAKIIDRIRANVARKITCYFFTDDNFARNPHWREILDGLARLRRDEGLRIEYFMQVDALAYRIPGFVEAAAAAGCYQVFIGMESLNPDDLAGAGKGQNRVEDYREMVDAWHRAGIGVHVGYIIGFPHDTLESVREDMRRLRDEIGVDLASFFMLTPLPGSEDYRDLRDRGEWMDPDLNRYDSVHATTRHPRMTAGEWAEAYAEAWRGFYSVESMKKTLARVPDRLYWGLFKNSLWCRHSVVAEGSHPMISGFFRIRDRRQRRPGFAVDPLWRHVARRTREFALWGREMFLLYFQMQEVWLATRGRPKLEENLVDLRARYAEVRDRLGESAAGVRARLGDSAARAGQALGRQAALVRVGAGEAWERAGQIAGQFAGQVGRGAGEIAGGLRSIGRGPFPRLRALAARLNPFAIRIQTRAGLNAYWKKTTEKLRRGQLFRINPFTLAVNFARDLKVCILFNISVLTNYGK